MLISFKIFALWKFYRKLSSANEAAFICQRSRLHLPTKPIAFANEAYCVCHRSLLRLPTKPIAFFSPIYLIEVSQVFPTRPEGAEALSPGHRPG